MRSLLASLLRGTPRRAILNSGADANESDWRAMLAAPLVSGAFKLLMNKNDLRRPSA
jgi:hypothetical protein